jgi:hypothetical protein
VKIDKDSKKRTLLGFVPIILLAFMSLSYLSAYLRTGFWADDFLQLGTFYHDATPFGHSSVTIGRYWANVYWGVSTSAFGTTSDTSYLLLTTTIFFSSLILLFLALKPILNLTSYLWVLTILFATGFPLPLMLWSSNNVHTIALLIISIGIFSIFRQHFQPDTARATSKYSIIESLTYSLLLFANPLYSPFIIIGVITWVIKFRHRLMDKPTRSRYAWSTYFFFAQVILPFGILFFFSIPNTLHATAYQHASFSYILKNLQYYRIQITVTHLQVYSYCFVFILGGILLVSALVRRNWLALLFLYLGFAILIPVLMQQNQHFLNYLVAPTLNIMMGIFLEFNSIRKAKMNNLQDQIISIILLILFFNLFAGSTSVREWWIDDNPGYGISSLRNQIASLVPSGASLCLEENLNPAQINWLVGGLGGQWGLMHSPVNASSVIFTPLNGCPVDNKLRIIKISPNQRSFFIAQLMN